MAMDVTELVVGSNGSLWVADPGTAVPADIDVAFGTGWADLGFATDDGITWTVGREITDIPAWQSFYPLRKIVTSVSADLAFSMMQWSTETLTFALGGGTVTGTLGKYEYHPPDPSVIDERMLAAEWIDGDVKFRIIYERGIVSENVEAEIARAAAAVLPVTYSALGTAGEDPFIIQTNSEAFAPAA